MEYTKGEWKVDETTYNGHGGYSIISREVHLATVYLNYTTSRISREANAISKENIEARANAHLIAAAPDTYESLKWALAIIEPLKQHWVTEYTEAGCQHKIANFLQQLEIACKSIAKSEGR